MPQCNLSPSGTHRYVPSPTTLSSVTCLHCNHTKVCTKAKCASKYLKYRRAMQHAQGLRNITVSLEEESAQGLNDVLAEAGIRAMTTGGFSGGNGSGDGGGGGGGAVTYVTLLEGLLPETTHHLQEEAPSVVDAHTLRMQIDGLRSSLQIFSTVTVRKLHKIRRSDRTSDLLLADVTLHPNVTAQLATLAESQNCVLPQYPCYIALGTVNREGRVSVTALKSIRKLLQGRPLEIQGTSMQCKPLFSPSNNRGVVNKQLGSLPSAGYNNIPRDPAMHHHQHQQYHHQNQQNIPYKLRHQPEFVRSASNQSAGASAVGDRSINTDCEQTAYLSESSNSDHEAGGDYKLPSPPHNTTVDTYVAEAPAPTPISRLGRPGIITRHASAPVYSVHNRGPTGHYIGKNPSMDEADVICDLTFLDSNTPPGSPIRPEDASAPTGGDIGCRKDLQGFGHLMEHYRSAATAFPSAF